MSTSSLVPVTASFALTASFTPNAVVTASVSSNTITFTKGNGTTFPITVNTGSTFPFTGSAIISGSLTNIGNVVTSGSVRGQYQTLTIASSTASINCDSGDYFTLTLPSGSTHISASNVNPGQTISVIVTTPSSGTGSVTFSSNVKTVNGAGYTPSSGPSNTDALTFISTPSNNLLMIPSNNFV